MCQRENIRADQVVLHSDNAGSMKGATMLGVLVIQYGINHSGKPRSLIGHQIGDGIGGHVKERLNPSDGLPNVGLY